jgi:hypothetical protein
MAVVKEYLQSTDNFNKPLVVYDKDAIYILLVKLALLRPGTYQTHPDMGLGLMENYRYSFAEDVDKLQTDFKSQIETYLPFLNLVSISADVVDHTLALRVNIDNTLYSIELDTETKTLLSI